MTDTRSASVRDGSELPPGVRVVAGLGFASRPVALVLLYGEHDHRSRGMLEDALAPLRGDVIVDLSWCRFVDLSVVAIMLAKDRALGTCGCRLEVIVPPSQRRIGETFDRLGVRTLLGVHRARSAGHSCL